jgi:hypothetical protein
MGHNPKASVVRKPHRAELAVKKFRLIRVWVDAYFGGFQHVSVSRYNINNIGIVRE